MLWVRTRTKRTAEPQAVPRFFEHTSPRRRGLSVWRTRADAVLPTGLLRRGFSLVRCRESADYLKGNRVPL
jgi:hypothetical protein